MPGDNYDGRLWAMPGGRFSEAAMRAGRSVSGSFPVHFEEGAVVNGAIYCGGGHGFAREDIGPRGERMVGGDGDGVRS